MDGRCALNVDTSDEEKNAHKREVDRELRATATPAQIFANIVTGGLGTGILTMPWLMAGSTLVPGLIIMAVVMALNVWTLGILFDVAEVAKEYDVADLLRYMGGSAGQRLAMFVRIFTFASLFFTLIGYVMVTAQNLVDMGIESVPSYKWLCLISTLLVLPLCYLNQARLSFSSYLCVVVFMYMLILTFVCIKSAGVDINVCVFGTGEGYFSMIGGIANCCVIQMCILPMYAELKNRTPKVMKKTVAASYMALYALFCCFATSGYVLFGKDADVVVLESIAKNYPGPATTVALVGLSASLIFVYPIICYGMMAPVYGVSGLDKYANIIIAIAVISAGLLATIMKGKLGVINNVNGAVNLTVHAFGVPAILGHFVLGKSGLTMSCTFLLGIVLGVVGLVWLENYIETLSCLW